MAKPKSKKKNTPEYSFICIKITNHSVAVDASVNYEVLDKRHQPDRDTKVYNFGTRIEIEGQCTYPEENVDELYYFTIYGSERRKKDYSATLQDCQLIDEKWQPVYKTVKGQMTPVYDIPKSVGSLERRRGTKAWTGWLFLPPKTVTDMLILLSRPQQLYVCVHRLHDGERFHMRGFELQTNDPAEE